MTHEEYIYALLFLGGTFLVLAVGALVSDYIIQPWLDKREK